MNPIPHVFFVWYTYVMKIGSTPIFYSSSRGFTLAEVLTVIVVLGALVALAVPSFNIQMKKIKNQEAMHILYAIYSEQLDFERENGYYADSLGALDFELETPLKNFDRLEARDRVVRCGVDSFNYLGEIRDIGGEYWLYLLEDPNVRIVCKPTSGQCPGSLCTKMGFGAW